jgi:hypothetical protein
MLLLLVLALRANTAVPLSPYHSVGVIAMLRKRK